MTIEALIAAVPPPPRPYEAFAGPWKVMEDWLGAALPQDYKDFSRVYGPGSFLEFLGIYIPHTRNPHSRLEQQIGAVCRIFAGLGDEESPYPFWPEPGGLVPLGVTYNGDYLFWLPKGATPEDWRVVVWDRGADLDPYEEFDCSLTDFLAGLATGEITPRAFPADLLPDERPFISSSEFETSEAHGVSGLGSSLHLKWRTRFAWPGSGGW